MTPSILFLLGCALFPKRAEPLALEAALPSADSATLLPARRLVVPYNRAGDMTVSDRDQEALCAWVAGSAADDRIAEKLMAADLLSYNIIEASTDGVRFAGEAVVPLMGGRLAEDDVRGLMVTHLYDRLIESAESSKALSERCGGEPFAGEIGLAFSPEVPFKTVQALMYTAGQAQFGTFMLLVDSDTQVPYTHSAPGADTRQAVIALGSDAVTVRIGGQDQTTTLPDLPAALAGTAHGPLGCGLLVTEPTVPWRQVVAATDALVTSGARNVIFAVDSEQIPVPPVTPGAPGSLRVQLDSELPVLVSALPAIRAGGIGGECSPVFETWTPSARGDGLGGIGSVRTATPNNQLAFGALEVSEGLDAPQVEAVLRRLRGQLRYCYQRELRTAPGLSGALTVRLEIVADGGVEQVAIVGDTVGSAPVSACVEGRFRRMTFPAPRSGAAVVTQELVYQPEP